MQYFNDLVVWWVKYYERGDFTFEMIESDINWIEDTETDYFLIFLFYLFIYLFIYIFIYLSIYLFIYF